MVARLLSVTRRCCQHRRPRRRVTSRVTYSPRASASRWTRKSGRCSSQDPRDLDVQEDNKRSIGSDRREEGARKRTSVPGSSLQTARLPHLDRLPLARAEVERPETVLLHRAREVDASEQEPVAQPSPAWEPEPLRTAVLDPVPAHVAGPVRQGE